MSRPLLRSTNSSSRSASLAPPSPNPATPTPANVRQPLLPPSMNTSAMHVKRITLTSKKNWWMVEMDEEEDRNKDNHSFSSSEETAISHGLYQPESYQQDLPSPPDSAPIYKPSRHPTAIFSFPTPTSYCAPPNPTANLAPVAHGSTSELFKCVVKKPDVVQLEINGEMQSNATDVTTQFLAELRVYTTVTRHRNICAFLGCLEGVGMVLEYIEGRTLVDVVRALPEISESQKVDYHNQLLDGLTHLHSFGLSHGDLSLTNVYVTAPADTIKLLDFGRSVSADSELTSPSEEPVDPFAFLSRSVSKRLVSKLGMIEQIHPGTRPFAAPEILRGECQDAILADAYSFGMILVCLDRCMLVDVKPWDQRKDLLPDGLLDGCDLFGERIEKYLTKWDQRTRLAKTDMIPVSHYTDL